MQKQEHPSKIRIKDIARMAGVSEGTVDRVLHDRKEVSAKSRAKVEAVLKEIQYRPNLYATALASQKFHSFAAVIPEICPGEYWEEVKRGMDAAAQELLDLNIHVRYFFFRQYDVDSYTACLQAVQEANPDGILWVPGFQEESETTWRHWDETGTPYLFVDSEIEAAHPVSFLGMDSFRSGYLVAKLLLSELPDSGCEIALLYANRQADTLHNQTVLRRAGFLEYLKRHRPDATVFEWPLPIFDPETCRMQLAALMDEHPRTVAAATFNSKVFRFSETLQAIDPKRKKNIRIIGYDLLPPNVTELKKGHLSYLIAQRPYEQGYRGMKELCDHIVFKKTVKRHIYVPIDILTEETVDFYLRYD